MYDHIGRKIKFLAKALACIGAVICFAIGIIIAAVTDKYVTGLLIAVFGGWIAWIGSFILYGYGQLIDNSDRMVELLSRRW